MLENLGLISPAQKYKDKSSHRLYDRNAGVVVLLENDENQHDWVPTLCDVKRMGECYETMAVGGNTLPLVFMRFHPHKYKLMDKYNATAHRSRGRLRMLNEVFRTLITKSSTKRSH
jgi:hypothetical protein